MKKEKQETIEGGSITQECKVKWQKIMGPRGGKKRKENRKSEVCTEKKKKKT